MNPHQLFRYPSTIWRVAQDLIDVMPVDLAEQAEIVAGPATGGALLAHTLAGLLERAGRDRTQVGANGTLTSDESGNANTKGKSATFNADPAKSYSLNVHVAAPTNGLPARSSLSPGCSPISITRALAAPSPNTV